MFFFDIDVKINNNNPTLNRTPPSSRGLGHELFTLVTGVRIPMGAMTSSQESDERSQKPFAVETSHSDF